MLQLLLGLAAVRGLRIKDCITYLKGNNT